MIHKFIYKLGQQFRNPSLKKQYLFLKKTENWTIDELESYQFKQLKKLLSEANLYSDFYKDRFKDIDISKITLKSFKEIPFLEKEELLENTDKIQTKIKFKKTFLATTSGSSGKSLKFYRNESADSFNRAASLRGYSWYEIKPWEKNGYFWGINFTSLEKLKSKFLDFLQNRFRIFSYKEQSIKKFALKALNAKYLHGYSSMIYQSAVVINKLNLPKPTKIKLVKGTSEKILDVYQAEIKKAFGVKMVSEYGATESGIIAFECSSGNMHINMEGVLVEEVDSEIVVTNLQMNSFPIIRYKLGDYIKLAPKEFKCKCGLQHRIIFEVTGRVGNNIYGETGVYPSLYLYYIFKNLSKKYNIELNYQVVQKEKGFLKFYIEQTLNQNFKQRLIEEIKKYFKEDISFTIIDNAIFVKEDKGKLKNFISKV